MLCDSPPREHSVEEVVSEGNTRRCWSRAVFSVNRCVPHQQLTKSTNQSNKPQVRSVEEVVSEGNTVEVLVMGRDARGNVKLSRKALLAGGGGAAAAFGAPRRPPLQRSRTA